MPYKRQGITYELTIAPLHMIAWCTKHAQKQNGDAHIAQHIPPWEQNRNYPT